MFDKIKDSIQKFSTNRSVDEEAVEQLVKDIQRDLIKADVDVSLVTDLSEEIREEALGEKKDGLSRKEHVLEVVYNKLEEMLGEEAEIEVKPHTILLAGLYGAGKCVSPDSKVQLSDGRRVSAESLYSENRPETVEELDNGFRYEVDGISAPSFNPETMEIEEKPVEYLWKLEKDEKLIEVGLDAGSNHDIQVTPEHPFFTLEEGEIVKKRADELSISEHVAVPRELEVGTELQLNSIIRNSLTQGFHYKDEKLSQKVKATLKSENETLMEGFEKLDLEFGYSWFIQLLSEKNEVPANIPQRLGLNTEKAESIVYKNSNSNEFSLPQDEKDFLEFLGYLLADGYIKEEYLEFKSGDGELIERWQKLSKDLFGIEPSRKSDKRSDKLEYSKISCKGVVKFVCDILDCETRAKSDKIKLSNKLLKIDSTKFEGFLKAYFDSDGQAQEGRHIEITSKSEEMVSQIRALLLRNKIFSSKSSKKTEGIKYHRITISGKNATKYAQKIGSSLKRKQVRLENYGQIQNFQGSGSKDMVPVDGELQKQRLKTCTSLAEIQKEVNSYGQYEKKESISRDALTESIEVMDQESRTDQIMEIADGKTRSQIIEQTDLEHSQFKEMVSSLKNNNRIEKKEDGTYSANKLEEGRLEQLKKLSKSDVNWVKVSEIKTTQEHEYVYDLTVKDNHSFIAENTIIHNTTTTGKLADFYRKREMKVGVIAADTDRAAAYDQLKQIAEDVEADFYGEKDVEDPVKVVESGKEKLDVDVLIVDSSGRNSLNDDLKKELSDMEKVLKPDEKYLVIPSDIGQSARDQAENFDEAVGLTGVIVTKMDSSAKGGGALVACKHADISVKFIGNGEEMSDLEVYDPVDFVSDMIGQPDLESLLEKIEELDTDPQEILEGEFTLKDFQEQMSTVTDSGMMEEMMSQLPFSTDQIPDNVANLTEGKIGSYNVIIDSMTPEEVNDPSILNRSRKERISEGSGRDVEEVNGLIKHYRQTKNMVDKFDKGSMKRGNMQNMMQKLGF